MTLLAPPWRLTILWTCCFCRVREGLGYTQWTHGPTYQLAIGNLSSEGICCSLGFAHAEKSITWLWEARDDHGALTRGNTLFRRPPRKSTFCIDNLIYTLCVGGGGEGSGLSLLYPEVSWCTYYTHKESQMWPPAQTRSWGILFGEIRIINVLRVTIHTTTILKLFGYLLIIYV